MLHAKSLQLCIYVCRGVNCYSFVIKNHVRHFNIKMQIALEGASTAVKYISHKSKALARELLVEVLQMKCRWKCFEAVSEFPVTLRALIIGMKKKYLYAKN